MDQAIVELPQVFLEHDNAKQIKHGQFISLDKLPESGLVRLYEEEDFIGIGDQFGGETIPAAFGFTLKFTDIFVGS